MPEKRGEWRLSQSRKMNKILEETVVNKYDVETGERIHQRTKTRYLSKRFDAGKGYLWRSGAGVKSFFDVPFPESMSMIDRGRMATLSRHIWHDTNALVYRGHGRLKPYDVAGIGLLLGLSPAQADAFIKRMKKLRIIKQIPVPFGEKIEQQYYVNPLYYFRGPRLSGNLYALFHEELEEYVPDWVKEEFAKADEQQN